MSIHSDSSPAVRYARGARRRHEQRFSTRAFWWTGFILVILAVVGFWPERQYGTLLSGSTAQLRARDLDLFEVSDEACRLVHRDTVTDKCAFVRKHCPSEEPGFLAYLDFYYCQLAGVRPVAFTLLVLWLGLLFSTIGIAASDFFCINLSTIATILGMSESLAGVTFLAFGNGSPDVFSTFAAMSTNSSSLAIGELIGAAGFITAVVAGSMALVRPFKVAKRSFIRDVSFFAIAAAFSMGFLSDGHLHLWECAAMVIYYFCYVAVVVLWHWWMTRRAKRRERDAAARGHYLIPGNEELAAEEEYHDEPDEAARSRPSISRGPSADDFRMLEDAGIPQIHEPEDDLDDDDHERWVNGITSNMRLRRPGRSRRNTITPVRPSLVGALEFQAVLGALSKSRSQQTIPLHQRRYSDDPSLGHQDDASVASAPASDMPQEAATGEAANTPRTPRHLLPPGAGRTRAVSANDASSLQLDPRFLEHHSRAAPNLVDILEDEDGRLLPPSPVSLNAVRGAGLSTTGHSVLYTDEALSPRSVATPNQNHSPDLSARSPDTNLNPGPRGHQDGLKTREAGPKNNAGAANAKARPQLATLRIASQSLSFPASSPTSPFPTAQGHGSTPSTRAPSFSLPPSASAGSQAFFPDDSDTGEDASPPSWWPTTILPAPSVLVSTLVPTLYHWKSKSWWEIMLGLVAAPSVFLLTITLPVVDADGEEAEEDDPIKSQQAQGHYTDSPKKHASPHLQLTIPAEDAIRSPSGAGKGAAGVAARVEQQHHNVPSLAAAPAEPTAPDHPHNASSPKAWNRWLTITQLYLAPIMIVLIIYTQYISPAEGESLRRSLVRPILIALLVSTVLLIPLLLTTTATKRPKAYLPILAFAGFVVSIAWISTIASQVVAVLKTFAIILNMSHAILGLTVFAVGNSLGDLVADITVARLGYPVMALSACFGGPMLNILLGIGLSGCWILIRHAQKRVEKGKHWKSGTYEIQVGDTLIVSGVTLLVTLVGLLIFVPLNKWMMSRRIAWSLIALWCSSTIINVGLEIAGVGSKKGA